MSNYNCIIVEDEPLAAEVLQDYISQVSFLTLKGVCTDALYAMEMLQKEKIDLMFLDIHLPKLKGLDFLKTLTHPPKVIFTTAHHEYAINGYELNALDYLLKPIEFSRFCQAVNKMNNLPGSVATIQEPTNTEKGFYYFNVGKKKIKLFTDDILYIESVKEYVKVVTKDKSIITKFMLSQMEELMTKNNFLRIHRSFLVSKSKIDAFTATDVEINNKLLPIGRSYKEAVHAALEK